MNPILKSLIIVIGLFIIQFNCIAQIENGVLFYKIPQNLQLYARELDNTATINIAGKIIDSEIRKLKFNIFRNRALNSSTTLAVSPNQKFEFNHKIVAELAENDLEIYGFKSETDSLLITTRKNIVAGDVYLITGQSNSYGGILNSSGQKRAELYQGEFARSFGVFIEPDNYADYNPADTLWNYSNIKNVVGMWGTELQKYIIETYKVPVCIINGGSSGSSSEYNSNRNEQNPADLTTAYGRLLYRAQKAGLSNKVKAFFYRQGENEADGATLAWKPNFEKLYKNLKTDLPSIQKVYIFQNNIYTFPNNLSGQLRDHQRIMQEQFSDLTTLATIGTDDFDGIHYNLKGHLQTGYEVFRIVAQDFYGAEKNANSKSPNITKAFYNPKSKTLVLQFDEGQVLEYPKPYNINDYTTIWIEEFLLIAGIQSYEIIGSADMNRLILKLKSDNIGNRVSYFPAYFQSGSYYNPYVKPVITNKWGMRALTFENFSIKQALETPVLQINKKNGIVKMLWSAIDQADEYVIERKSDNSNEYQIISKIKSNTSLEFTDNLAEKSINYFYRIKAVSPETESEFSAPQKVIFRIDLPIFNEIKAVSNQAIELNWNAEFTDADLLTVEFSTDSSFKTFQQKQLKIMDNKAIIDNLAGSTIYYFRFKASNQSEALASVLSTIYFSKTNPNAPNFVKFQAINTSEIKLEWTDNSPDELVFIIEELSGQGKFEVSANNTSFEIKNLKEATNYKFKIFAKNSEGNLSPASEMISGFTLPAAPTNLIAQAEGVFSVSLNWKDNSSGEVNYLIYKKNVKTEAFEKIAELAKNTNQYTVNQLTSNTIYDFKITAIGEGGASESSNTAQAQTFIITETEADLLPNTIKVFPNPANEKLFFTTKKSIQSPITLKLFGNNGQLILEKEYKYIIENYRYYLALHSIPKGRYIIQFSTNKSQISNSLIIR